MGSTGSNQLLTNWLTNMTLHAKDCFCPFCEIDPPSPPPWVLPQELRLHLRGLLNMSSKAEWPGEVTQGIRTGRQLSSDAWRPEHARRAALTRACPTSWSFSLTQEINQNRCINCFTQEHIWIYLKPNK